MKLGPADHFLKFKIHFFPLPKESIYCPTLRNTAPRILGVQRKESIRCPDRLPSGQGAVKSLTFVSMNV